MKYDNKSFSTYAQPVVEGTKNETNSTKKVLPEIILKIHFIYLSAKSTQRRTRKNH